MPFCSSCGKEIDDTSKFCNYCGKPVNNLSQAGSTKENTAILALTNELSRREKIASVIWIVIGCIQILLGLFLNWLILIPGVWNIIAGISRNNQSKKVLKPYPTMCDDYDKWLISIIIVLIINIVLGAVIGIIGCIYDFFTRNFVLKNKALFSELSESIYVNRL